MAFNFFYNRVWRNFIFALIRQIFDIISTGFSVGDNFSNQYHRPATLEISYLKPLRKSGFPFSSTTKPIRKLNIKNNLADWPQFRREHPGAAFCLDHKMRRGRRKIFRWKRFILVPIETADKPHAKKINYRYPTFFNQYSFSHSHNFFAPRKAAKSSFQ